MPEHFHAVPDWFSHENQGGAIAATRLEGDRKLLAFMIDQPPGQNAGTDEVLDPDPDPDPHPDPAEAGRWELLPFHSGVLAVPAALLPHGPVLFLAGSGSSAT